MRIIDEAILIIPGTLIMNLTIQNESVVLTIAKSSLNEKPLLLAIAIGMIAYAILKE